MVKELRAMGATSKSWTTQDGRFRQGTPIHKSMIYRLLNNRTYLGELRHREEWVNGEHPAIIEQPLWDKVQAILKTNSRVRGNRTRAKVPFLLKGLIFGSDGRAMSPNHTRKKNGRLYRYYIPQRDAKEHAGVSGLPRLPADEIETAVINQLRGILRSETMIQQILPNARQHEPAIDEAQVTVAMTQLDAIWEELFPTEQQRIAQLLIQKVTVSSSEVQLQLHSTGLQSVALELHQPQAGAA